MNAGLSDAAETLRRAALQRAAATALHRAGGILLASGAVAIAIALACRAIETSPTWPTVAASLLGVCLAGASAFALLLKRTNMPAEFAAERLALAAKDHNVIASALDVARSGDYSPMARHAIKAGLTTLDSIRSLATDRPTTQYRQAVRHPGKRPRAKRVRQR